jgi:putative membrane protein
MATVPITAALMLAGLVYLRGWGRLQKTSPSAIPLWRVASFFSGLLLVWLAAASPLAMLDQELLTAHMVQHLLLMTVGPAFILLGFPRVAMGIPDWFQKMTPSPVFCWCASAAVLILWHVPAAFAVSLHSMMWHNVEQTMFFFAGLLFWLPVIPSRPGPFHAQWPVVIYLFMATLPCDALSAFLAFCGRVVYPAYERMPRGMFASALQDQQCAGALMWTVVTFAYLIPAALLTVRMLSNDEMLTSRP